METLPVFIHGYYSLHVTTEFGYRHLQSQRPKVEIESEAQYK